MTKIKSREYLICLKYKQKFCRKSLASKCLDLIAMFLLELESPHSFINPEKSQLIDSFKTLQRVFERI